LDSKLEDLVGTRWQGTSRLWHDPDPDAPAELSEATVSIEAGVVRYTWVWEGKPHVGSFELRPTADGTEATFTDTWHQVRPMQCRPVPTNGAMFSVIGTYAAPGDPPWRWRSLVGLRPTGELVLEMINVTPWGEEARAVLIVAKRVG
jgi:hypothetical protein